MSSRDNSQADKNRYKRFPRVMPGKLTLGSQNISSLIAFSIAVGLLQG